ncbi:MAG: metallophosphoesterase [Clostridia bacterium]|nr:metallophosphoesterase [Clostridia bacterium]
MSKTRMFQALWLLLLSVVCVLMFYYRREPTKSDQEVLVDEDTVVAVAAPERTPVPTPMPSPTPAPTVYEITEVFIPLIQTPTPVLATLPPELIRVGTAVPATPAPTATPAASEPFSLIWFSDTQYYAYKKPEIFLSMADWAVRVRQEYNAVAVVCTGDIVDNRNYTRHWTNAEAAILRVREAMPFYCVAGNHDVGADKVEYETYLEYDLCSSPSAMAISDDGHCWALPLPEQGILLCGIGWQNDTSYADWVNERIAEYADLPAVLLVHSFLNDDGSLSTNGKRVEKAILRESPSVRLVLCGHNDGSARWSRTYDDGHTVNAMMYNFQDDKKYGLGYARILMFNPGTRNVAVTTYSPYLNDYNYYRDSERDTFTIYDAW